MLGAVPVEAQTQALSVIISDKPDPASSGAQVSYVINVKNLWNRKATNVVATIPVPSGTTFVSCVTAPKRACSDGGGTVTATIGTLFAGATNKITLVLTMPTPAATTTVTLNASATADSFTSGSGQQGTTVLAGSGSDPNRGTLIVDVSDTPDPAPTLGQVTYAITVKNDGTASASSVIVTVPLPPTAQFVKCATTPSRACTASNGTVTVTFGSVAGHATVKISLILKMPSVDASSTIQMTASANGDGVNDGDHRETTTILPATANVVFLPSNTSGSVSCGDTLSGATFGGDSTMQLQGGLGCASQATALTMQAAGKTIDLAGFKLVGDASASDPGNVGIQVANATNVTILGGGTAGTNGIEYWDFGVRADAASTGLTIDQLRVFRARSAGIETTGDGVTLSNLLIDKTVAVPNATTASPGGVGIHASGSTLIDQTIVRRNRTFGVWADGTHVGANGFVTRITGSVNSSQADQNAGIGVQLDNGPHSVKDMVVVGDGASGTSTHGVVVGPTGTGIVMEGVVVKSHGGNGIVSNGTGTSITSCTIDPTVSGDGFVIGGTGGTLSNNDSQALGNGYVITGDGTFLESNSATAGNYGFLLNANGVSLRNNNAIGNGARGYVVAATNSSFDTNIAQFNAGHGWFISGNTNTFVNGDSTQNGAAGYSIVGTGNHFNSNSASLNTGSEWIIGSGNIDDGGNRRNGSGFTFTSSGGTFN